MKATNVFLDLTAIILALIWLVGFFGYARVGTSMDVMPGIALIIVVTRYVLGMIQDRKRRYTKLRLTDYDAEH